MAKARISSEFEVLWAEEVVGASLRRSCGSVFQFTVASCNRNDSLMCTCVSNKDLVKVGILLILITRSSIDIL